jgi:hypothetical protein
LPNANMVLMQSFALNWTIRLSRQKPKNQIVSRHSIIASWVQTNAFPSLQGKYFYLNNYVELN